MTRSVQLRAHVDDVRPIVGAYDVPRGQWRSFLRRFVERHAGAPVSVQLLKRESHETLEPRRCSPFHGARCGTRADGSEEILVTIGEPPYMLEPFFVVGPVRVRVEQRDDGKLVIRIEAESGAVLVLCFSRQVGRSTGPLALLV